jgi:phosphatidylglycerophosphate synthase
MPYHPRYSMLLYSASSLLDVADGYAARLLNQSSEFGAVLDMVTDRYAGPSLLVPGTDAHGLRDQMRNIVFTMLPRLCIS